jgi:hypothetical protein
MTDQQVQNNNNINTQTSAVTTVGNNNTLPIKAAGNNATRSVIHKVLCSLTLVYSFIGCCCCCCNCWEQRGGDKLKNCSSREKFDVLYSA